MQFMGLTAINYNSTTKPDKSLTMFYALRKYLSCGSFPQTTRAYIQVPCVSN